MADGEVTQEMLASLAAKLRSLDLTDDEAAAMGTILRNAASAEDEVEGFGVVFEIETTFKGSDEELQAMLRRGIGSKVWTDMRPLFKK